MDHTRLSEGVYFFSGEGESYLSSGLQLLRTPVEEDVKAGLDTDAAKDLHGVHNQFKEPWYG